MVLFFPVLVTRLNGHSVISVTEDTKEHPFESEFLIHAIHFILKYLFQGVCLFFPPELSWCGTGSKGYPGVKCLHFMRGLCDQVPRSINGKICIPLVPYYENVPYLT